MWHGAVLYDVVSDLQRGSVSDQEPDLQVHQVQIGLQLPVEADAPHHFLSQAQKLRLLSDVTVSQIEQVKELPDHRQGGRVRMHCERQGGGAYE